MLLLVFDIVVTVCVAVVARFGVAGGATGAVATGATLSVVFGDFFFFFY